MSDEAVAMVRQMQQQVDEARQAAVTRTRIGLLLGAGVAALFSGATAVSAVGAAVAGTWAVAAGLSVAAAVTGGLVLLQLGVAAGMRRPEDLRQTGLPATATYLRPTGGSMSIQVNGGGMRGNVAQFALAFRVEVPGRAPYEVVVKDFVPTPAVGRLVPGAAFPVFVDRRKPKRVLVDWAAA